MKLLRSKSFLRQLSILSPIEKLEVLDLLIKVENNTPYIEENISPNVIVILYRYIKKYQEHKNHVSDVRRAVRWINKEAKHTTIVNDIQNNCTDLHIDIPTIPKISKKIKKDIHINTTIVNDIKNNCTDSRFPPCPWKDDIFPEPDISILWPAPEDYSPQTPWFWNIFLTLNLQALNDLPPSWYEITRDIEDRMFQIEKATCNIPKNI